MRTLPAVYFATRRRFTAGVSAIVLGCICAGCTSLPPNLKDLGAQLLEKCPAGVDLESDANSILVVSIESDLFFDEFYLLIEKDSVDKYLLRLRAKKFVIPTPELIKRGRAPANTYCYTSTPGTFHISEIIGIFSTRGPGSTSVDSVVFEHSREFTVTANKATYLGRYLLLDPRMKGKDYFGRVGAILGGPIPTEIEINVVDSIDEDSACIRRDHKKISPEDFVDLAN